MEAIYLFILLLIGLTVIFGIVLGASSRIEVMENWSQRRCDLDVLLSAFLYKPDGYKGSSMEFEAENFNFCIGAMASDYMQTVFGALFAVMQKQMSAAEIMTSVLQSLRASLAGIFAPFSKIMNKFYNKFMQVGSLASRIFQHLYMSMKMAAGTAVAAMFSAISLQVAFLNSIELVIKIIMVIFYILVVFAIIFFLPVLPALVFVFMAITGIEQAYPGRTGGVGSIFCFLPRTKIIMRDGTDKNIEELELGETLFSGGIVEAVIELPGSEEVLYDLYGVIVSGGHKVWSFLKDEFICVKDHPSAVATKLHSKTLWTLITSDREIPVRGKYGCIRFSDWEELPSTEASSAEWDIIAYTMLNFTKNSFADPPKNAPCLDRSILVKKYQGGWMAISKVGRGDWILDENGWTRVIGICEREVYGGIGEKGSRMTDGIWIRQENGSWDHPKGNTDGWAWRGCQLITESGSFVIKKANSDIKYCVRDFTEVGKKNLMESYTREDVILNDILLKKKVGVDKKSK
jgi:hypothetical protein